jgi:hypothetical protein
MVRTLLALFLIKAPLYAINSADDEVNPPELRILDREIKRVRQGRYILIPTSAETRGHGTHSRAAVWKRHLVELLAESEPGIARNLRRLSSDGRMMRRHCQKLGQVRGAKLKDRCGSEG